MKSTVFSIASLYFIILFSSIGVSNVYAQELSYDKKLEFSLKVHEIVGHMISALDNINEKKYALAKMHLLHPMAEHSDIVNFLPTDNACSQKLPLLLQMIQATDPEYDIQVTAQRFSYVFAVLDECNDLVSSNVDSNFNVDLIGKILDKSKLEYESSLHTSGMGEIMKQQDSLGLVIRAHMLFVTHDIADAAGIIEDGFQKLFFAHMNEKPLSDVTILTDQLYDKMIRDEVPVSSDLTSPALHLKSIPYSNGIRLLEIHGDNFGADQKITVNYFSPISEKNETVSSHSTSKGKFIIPFEFVKDSFDESIMLSVTTNDLELYEVLSITD